MDFIDSQPGRRSCRRNSWLAFILTAVGACADEALAVGAEPTGEQTSTAAPVFPLSPSPDGRYLVDAAGTPFPILGDSGWEAQVNLTASEQATYVADRVGRGFTTVLMLPIDHKYTVNKPPKNRADMLPFMRRLDGAPYTGSPNGTTSSNGSSGQFAADPYGNVNAQAPDFTHPESAYWSGVDDYVSLCEGNGLLVLMWPAYVGYGGGDQGWMAEMVANDAVTGAGGFAGQGFADDTKSKLWNYGAWIANRYRGMANILWVHGGDYGNAAGVGGGFTLAQKKAVNDLFAGMKSVPGQMSVMHTGHWQRRSLATDVSFTAGAFDLQAAYPDTASAQWGRTAYARLPVRPAFVIEGYYEGHPTGGEPNRRFQWWAQLSAIGGTFYGNEALWIFKSGWSLSLNSQGARDMGRLNAFVASHAWEKLVPSGLNGTATLITGGAGTPSPQSSDYVAAAAAPDGSLLVAYVPPAHVGTITVDMTAMATGGSSSLAKWFNPFTGSETVIGTFPNTGPRAFTPPGNNGSGFSDWVLVLEPATLSALPTVASPASANPNPLSGTTTTLNVLGADDGGEAGLTYTWATAGPPPAPVGFSPNGTNAAKSSTATFAQPGTYTLQVTITDGDGQSVTSSVQVGVNGSFTFTGINFQPAGAPIPAGYRPDTGAVYGDRGNGLVYGWNASHTDVTRDRNINPDQRLDTLCHFHAGGKWEISVAGGSYSVLVSIGDPGFPSTHTLNVEGVNYWQNVALGAGQFAGKTRVVTVTDGRLTIDQGSAGNMATRIDYVEITPSDGGVSQPPTIATPASATPNPVLGTTANLSVLGSDDGGEPSLTYTWATAGTPPAPVAFSASGSNAAKNASATFTKAGSYSLQVTIRDLDNQTTTSSVNVEVRPTLTSIVLSPAAATVAPSGSQQFTGTGKDQFGLSVSPQPSFNWAVSGCGMISAAGLFTAGNVPSGPCTVTATSGGVTGTASVAVTSIVVKINFQASTSTTPAGYLPDVGLAFGGRGNGYSYGWNIDNTAQARERNASNSPDKRYDTLDHFQRPNNPNGSWEIILPNGTYRVRIVSGDPSYLDSVFNLLAEGVVAISGIPTSSQRWFDQTLTVTVADGRLSLTNGAGSSNNKINFIEITGL